MRPWRLEIVMSSLSLLEKLYLYIHYKIFHYRKKRSVSFPFRVVSIGNLSAGGTGKTPLTMVLVEQALQRGLSPGVALRGYGKQIQKDGILVSDGRSLLSNYEECGDEAILFASIPGVKVMAGPDRNRLLSKMHDCDIVFLDDAFQNPTVERDLDVVLIDATVLPGQFRMIPCGKFREGGEALGRADIVILSRWDQADREIREFWYNFVIGFLPEEKIFRMLHKPAGFAPDLKLDFSTGFLGFCGIGNPDAFFDTLESLGLNIKERYVFQDHHNFKKKELAEIFAKNLPVVTTEKDYVRIRNIIEAGLTENQKVSGSGSRLRLYRLRVRAEIDKSDFFEMVFDD